MRGRWILWWSMQVGIMIKAEFAFSWLYEKIVLLNNIILPVFVCYNIMKWKWNFTNSTAQGFYANLMKSKPYFWCGRNTLTKLLNLTWRRENSLWIFQELIIKSKVIIYNKTRLTFWSSVYIRQSSKVAVLRHFLVFWLGRRIGGTNSPATRHLSVEYTTF